MIEKEDLTVVIDCGSETVKAGFSGEYYPRTIFPSIVGRPRFPGIMIGMNQKDYYVGHEAEVKRGILILKFPIEQGIVTNWDDKEKLWHHAFYSELKVAPEEHAVVLTEPPLNPKANRERMTQIMFETFNVPLLYVSVQQVLALKVSERKTGVVLDIGDGVSHAVCIYDENIVPYSISRLNLAGRDITDNLQKLLNARGFSFTTSSERKIIKDIKETICYVALDFEEEYTKCSKNSEIHRSYELADGDIICLYNETFRCPEILFQPYLRPSSQQGVHELLNGSITRCRLDIRKELYKNIVVAGASTMFKGFPERLEKELKKLAPVKAEVKVIAPENRNISTWLGASILANQEDFTSKCISRSDYECNGPNIVHKKCL